MKKYEIKNLENLIYLVLVIFVLILLIGITNYYIQPFHDISNDTTELSDGRNLSYQLGYSNDRELYLLLWIETGEISLDIVRIEQYSEGIFGGWMSIYLDIVVKQRGLRINFNTGIDKMGNFSLHVGQIGNVSEFLTFSNFDDPDMEQNYFNIIQPRIDVYEDTNFGLNTLYSILIALIIAIMLRRNGSILRMKNKKDNELQKLNYQNNVNKESIEKNEIENKSENKFKGLESVFLLFILYVAIYTIQNNELPYPQILIIISLIISMIYISRFQAINLMWKIKKKTLLNITFPVFLLFLYNSFFNWCYHFINVHIFNFLNLHRLCILITIFCGLLCTILISYDANAEFSKIRAIRGFILILGVVLLFLFFYHITQILNETPYL